ncbi:hypothetical protein [Microbacterium sp. SSM24]|uniref:hypothetical protein n=1 Tax=Microbacterium sp. SSM24 TaxID=2991714 RepID=UPI002227A333|nr:hypothetical protein [Microbacterium sp. SSM24]MCW3492130.1 hypothetical protein [Microbacterium sp. SSM24]
MSEDTRVGAPAPGWLYDAETGRTRWWDGVHWTDLAKPLDPVVRTGPAYRPASAAAGSWSTAPSAKNGPATTALVLVLVSVVGAVASVWLAPGLAPATAAVLGFAQVGVLVATFVLSLIGLVIAVRRPTRKREAVFGLVLSGLVLGVLAFRLVTGGAIDTGAFAGEIAAWVTSLT